MPAPHHLDLTDEELKDFLRKGFAYSNLATAIESALAELPSWSAASTSPVSWSS